MHLWCPRVRLHSLYSTCSSIRQNGLPKKPRSNCPVLWRRSTFPLTCSQGPGQSMLVPGSSRLARRGRPH